MVDHMKKRIDYTYWAIIEIMTAIMCANLPAMPSFIRHANRKSFKAVRILPRSYKHDGSSEHSRYDRFSLRPWFGRSIVRFYNSSDASRQRAGDKYTISQIDSKEEKSSSERGLSEPDLAIYGSVADDITRGVPQALNKDALIVQNSSSTGPYKAWLEQRETMAQKEDSLSHSFKRAIHVTREVDIESNMV